MEESNETKQYNLVEVPTIKDQVVSATVGSIVTIVITGVVGFGVGAIQKGMEQRKIRKLMKKAEETVPEEQE